MESSKHSIREAHSHINKLDFKEDSARTMPYIAKRMIKNPDVECHHGTLNIFFRSTFVNIKMF